jgi:hypothetical protein
MRWKWSLTLILLLPFSGLAFGQSADDTGAPPLGDVAKKNKDASTATPKSKPKRVFSDDDMSVRSNPIPVIALQGPDNTDNILNTIHDFKKVHDPAETERVVHEWFDEQSEVLSDAIDANVRLAQHNQLKMEAAQDGYAYANTTNYDASDYNRLRQHQLSEQWAQRSDARTARDNFQVITRIQQTFFRVRCDAILNRGKMPYDWFRIRNANGVGSY